MPVTLVFLQACLAGRRKTTWCISEDSRIAVKKNLIFLLYFQLWVDLRFVWNIIRIIYSNCMDPSFKSLLSIVSSLYYSSTRVTDMQVCHNFLAYHNQLPAKPPCRQQIHLTFLWRSLPFANCRIPLWQKGGFVDASIGMALFFMATCGRHLGLFAAPSGLMTTC